MYIDIWWALVITAGTALLCWAFYKLGRADENNKQIVEEVRREAALKDHLYKARENFHDRIQGTVNAPDPSGPPDTPDELSPAARKRIIKDD